MQAAEGGPARHARLLLPGGVSLIAAVTSAMAAQAWESANLQLIGGPITKAALHMSVLTPGGPRWIDYGPARMLTNGWLATGSATFGGGALHCHAAVVDDAGMLWGGHIDPQATQLAAAGLIAWATHAPGAGFALRPDGSGFTLLTPVAA